MNGTRLGFACISTKLEPEPSEALTVIITLCERPPTVARRVSSPSPARAPFRRELDALMGGHLLRGDRAPSLVRAPARRRIKRSISPVHAVMASILCLSAVASVGIVHAGMVHHAEQERIAVTHDVLQLIKVGSFAKAAEQVPAVARMLEGQDVTAQERRGLMRIEATLYRHHDADPERLVRIEKIMQQLDRDESYDLTVTRALLVSSVDRVKSLDALRRVAAQEKNDSEAEYLVAVALSRTGIMDAAEESFKRMEAIEPSHLHHLAAFADHYAKEQREFELEQLAARMRDVGPDTHWTHEAEAELRRIKRDSASERTDDPKHAFSPVERSRAELRSAIALFRARKTEAANEALEKAMAEVRHQEPFLLDMADELLAHSMSAGARQVLEALKETGTPLSSSALSARISARERTIVLNDVFLTDEPAPKPKRSKVKLGKSGKRGVKRRSRS